MLWNVPRSANVVASLAQILTTCETDFRSVAHKVHACPTAEGFEEVIMPGERERRLEAKHRRTGVPFHAKEVAAMQEALLVEFCVWSGPLADDLTEPRFWIDGEGSVEIPTTPGLDVSLREEVLNRFRV